jgi:hypothetical protein
MNDGHVERAVRERKGTCVALMERHLMIIGGALSCPVEEHGRWVHADDLRYVWPAREYAGDRTGAATDIEYARAFREADPVQVRLEHFSLARLGCPELQDRSKPFLNLPIDFGDHRVKIGHGNVSRVVMNAAEVADARSGPYTTFVP